MSFRYDIKERRGVNIPQLVPLSVCDEYRKECAMFKRLLSVTLVFGMAGTAPPALASACAERESVVEQLKNKYDEQLTVGGLQNGDEAQSVVEIWSSEETGTFTVLLTHATGITCVMAAGTDFFEAIRKTPLNGSEG